MASTNRTVSNLLTVFRRWTCWPGRQEMLQPFQRRSRVAEGWVSRHILWARPPCGLQNIGEMSYSAFVISFCFILFGPLFLIAFVIINLFVLMDTLVPGNLTSYRICALSHNHDNYGFSTSNYHAAPWWVPEGYQGRIWPPQPRTWRDKETTGWIHKKM